jgi:hypothetical protein
MHVPASITSNEDDGFTDIAPEINAFLSKPSLFLFL